MFLKYAVPKAMLLQQTDGTAKYLPLKTFDIHFDHIDRCWRWKELVKRYDLEWRDEGNR